MNRRKLLAIAILVAAPCVWWAASSVATQTNGKLCLETLGCGRACQPQGTEWSNEIIPVAHNMCQITVPTDNCVESQDPVRCGIMYMYSKRGCDPRDITYVIEKKEPGC